MNFISNLIFFFMSCVLVNFSLRFVLFLSFSLGSSQPDASYKGCASKRRVFSLALDKFAQHLQNLHCIYKKQNTV